MVSLRTKIYSLPVNTLREFDRKTIYFVSFIFDTTSKDQSYFLPFTFTFLKLNSEIKLVGNSAFLFA